MNAEFVACMEDVLDLYEEPYDEQRPKVNFDEASKQLIKETRQPLEARPGRPERYDYEYERAGTRNLFLFTEPQAGWRHATVTEQRTKLDFAHQMKWLVDERYPGTVMNGYELFIALNSPAPNTALYRTDGTFAGTSAVSTSGSPASSSFGSSHTDSSGSS